MCTNVYSFNAGIGERFYIGKLNIIQYVLFGLQSVFSLQCELLSTETCFVVLTEIYCVMQVP